jgi:hypothetical protein
MCYIDGQKNKYSVLKECNRMLKYNIFVKELEVLLYTSCLLQGFCTTLPFRSRALCPSFCCTVLPKPLRPPSLHRIAALCRHPLHMFLPFLEAIPASVDHTAFLKLLSGCFFLLLQGNAFGTLVSPASLRHSTTLPRVQHAPPCNECKSEVSPYIFLF